VVSVQNGVTITSPGLVPATVSAGDDIVGETIDMLGEGSATSAFFQSTTIDPTTAIDISGVALFENYYNNTLAGTINVGLPISANGAIVATPTSDSHGVANELDLQLFGDGSVNESADTLSSYVPLTDNTGTINVAADSALRIGFNSGPLFGETLSATEQFYTFAGQAALENDGAINVAAGGTLSMTSNDQLYDSGSAPADEFDTSAVDNDKGTIFWDGLVNTGQINIAGAAGQTTTVNLQGFVAGSGTIAVNGGNQTDRTKTTLTFTGAVVDGQTIIDSNAIVQFFADSGDNFTRAVGGSFIFGDVPGDLLIDPDTLQNGAGFGPPGYSLASGTVTSAAVDQPFGMPIYGFRPGDTIAVATASIFQATTYKLLWTQATDTLQVEEIPSVGNSVIAAQFTLMGNYTQSEFTQSLTRITADAVLGDAAFSGYLVSIGVACFAAGTRIATPSGERDVEDLRVGDHVMTPSGARRVKWLGHRRFDCRRHPKPADVWPVRISAGAFGPGLPARELFLSPDHAVFAEGVLIPIKYLINGASIVQEPRETVTYWHVELERHDVILAEGLPCESYLDTGNRDAFANGSGAVQLHPDFMREGGEAIWEAAACAPLRIEGEAVGRVMARLRRRAKQAGCRVATGSRQRWLPRRATSSDLARLLQPEWYLAENPDVAAFGMDAVAHYAGWGWAEGRLPCPAVELVRGLGLIDPGLLIFSMEDVVAAGVDPVAHFCETGWRERRRPNPYFDTGWYLDTHEVPAGMNPLLHYVLTGESVPPGRHFDPVWYRRRYALAATVSPLAHYLAHRRTQRVSPRPSFDVAAYVKSHGDTLRPERDAYAHYLAIGRFVADTGQVDRGHANRAAA
jgi:hypothetical protein